MDVIEAYLRGMPVDPNDPILQDYLMNQAIYRGQQTRPIVPLQGESPPPVSPPVVQQRPPADPRTVRQLTRETNQIARDVRQQERQTDALPDVPMPAGPNINTPQTTVFNKSNAYLAAYNQAKTSQYFQMLDLLLKQQTVEQGNLDIIRKAIADIDDRIADYEKAAAEFETPKSSGGGGSRTVKNFRLEAEAEINRLALKSLEQQTRLTEQVGRDTIVPPSTLSFFTGDSSNRVNSINANPSDMTALISQLQQPTYVNQFASITNTTARNDATGELLRQVTREMVAGGVPTTEQEKVYDVIAANYGGLASSTPASRSSTFSKSAVNSQREAEIERKLRDVYDLKDASTVPVPAKFMKGGVPTLPGS